MKTSSNGRKLIETFEGCILQAYDDFNDQIVPLGGVIHGTLTIGYGHTSAAGAPIVFIGQTITKDEADTILSTDLEKVEREVTDLVKVPLNQNQFDALVSFQFNTGALGRSTLLKFLNNNEYSEASHQFLAWDHVGSNVVEGLERRREAERRLFILTDVYVTPPKQTSPAPSVGFWQSIINFFTKGNK